MVVGKIQLGKNGVTDNFILTLVSHFKHHNVVKISVLKSARGEGKEGKKDVKKYANQLLNAFGPKYTTKIIGFAIALKKWRRDQR